LNNEKTAAKIAEKKSLQAEIEDLKKHMTKITRESKLLKEETNSL